MLVLNKLVWPCSHRCVGQLANRKIWFIIIDMFWDDIGFCDDVIQGWSAHRWQDKLDSVIIHFFKSNWLPIDIETIGIAIFFLNLLLVGKDDIICVEGFAIRPLDILAQFDRDAETIFSNHIAFCQFIDIRAICLHPNQRRIEEVSQGQAPTVAGINGIGRTWVAINSIGKGLCVRRRRTCCC